MFARLVLFYYFTGTPCSFSNPVEFNVSSLRPTFSCDLIKCYFLLFPLQRGMKEFEWPRSTWPPRDESGPMMAARQAYETTGVTIEESAAQEEQEDSRTATAQPSEPSGTTSKRPIVLTSAQSIGDAVPRARSAADGSSEGEDGSESGSDSASGSRSGGGSPRHSGSGGEGSDESSESESGGEGQEHDGSKKEKQAEGPTGEAAAGEAAGGEAKSQSPRLAATAAGGRPARPTRLTKMTKAATQSSQGEGRADTRSKDGKKEKKKKASSNQ